MGWMTRGVGWMTRGMGWMTRGMGWMTRGMGWMTRGMGWMTRLPIRAKGGGAETNRIHKQCDKQMQLRRTRELRGVVTVVMG